MNSRDALVRFRLSSGIIPAVLYAVNIFIADNPKNVGNRCGIELILMHWVRSVPRPIPKRDVVVNWETAFPAMSPTLFYLANLTLIEARDAAANRKQIFLPTLASDARAKKCVGNLRVMISM